MDTLRYIKLHNNGLFVAQILVEYKERSEDGQGNVGFAAEWKEWQSSGDRNILQFNERSVDLLSDSDIPDGAIVRLHPYIVAGYSDAATEQFIYSKASPSQAVYEIDGTTLGNQLRLISYRLTSEGPIEPENPTGPVDPSESSPERSDGFTYRDIQFIQTGAFATYKIMLSNIREDLNYRYGVASYNTVTGKAEDIPERGWYDSEDGKIIFPILFGASFVVTSDGTVDIKKVTPAQRFNEGRGVKVVAPGSDQFYLMRPVLPSAVRRSGNTLIIRHTSVTQQYTLMNLNTGFPAFMWIDGNGGDLGFDYAVFPDYPVMAVTREKDYNRHIILPARPSLVPGADPAHTKASFDERTAQGLLTVDVTEGFAYAIADESGRLLGRGEKEFWSITADTEQNLTVTANELGFYEAPALGKQILFRVPPGGKYYMLTRLDDGSVVRSDEIKVPSVGKNVTVSDNKVQGKPQTVVRIEPISIFAEYATVDKRTGETNQYITPRLDDDFLRIETNIPKDQVTVVARPKQFPFSPVPFPPFPPESGEAGESAHAEDPADTLPVLRRVTEGDVRRVGNEITVTVTAEDQEYALYVPGAVNPGSA